MIGRRKRDGNHSPKKNNSIHREIKKIVTQFLTATKQK
jgi:hypothetical protein